MPNLREATEKDWETIARFVRDMVLEVGEFPPESVAHVPSAIQRSFQDKVQWFLFLDDAGQPFGTCYCQSLFTYWSDKQRFYLGAFYILPSHRNKGHMQAIYQQMKNWAISKNGFQICCLIHKDNLQSQKAFRKAGCDHLDEMQIFFDAF